ncbi:hypothetical protein GGI07_003804 [Coemansia sp. Benny D115]|nr:hypothetical protein GGI07_003804 [Coemansia sp. Benny D115]
MLANGTSNTTPSVSQSWCAQYKDCWTCVRDDDCGYFGHPGVCVPGGWFSADKEYVDVGRGWSYHHGQCYVSTRVEYVVLPAILVLAVLMAATLAIWRRWTQGDNEEGSVVEVAEEHMPLLIDNDPASRPDRLGVAMPPGTVTDAPLEGQYGSWCQRSSFTAESMAHSRRKSNQT